MPKNYWMVVQTPENFEKSRELRFTVHGLRARQRRRAQRMEPDDRVLYYVSGLRKWTAIASVTSRYFEDRTPLWESLRGGEDYPYRVKLSPSIVLDEHDYIDALELGPRLEYVKRWPPERWPLAFHDTLHLLPQRDFRLIEGEMKRIVSGRRGRRRRGRSQDYRGDGRHRADQRPQANARAEADRDVTGFPPDGPVEPDREGPDVEAEGRPVAAPQANVRAEARQEAPALQPRGPVEQDSEGPTIQAESDPIESLEAPVADSPQQL